MENGIPRAIFENALFLLVSNASLRSYVAYCRSDNKAFCLLRSSVYNVGRPSFLVVKFKYSAKSAFARKTNAQETQTITSFESRSFDNSFFSLSLFSPSKEQEYISEKRRGGEIFLENCVFEKLGLSARRVRWPSVR